MGKKKVKGKTSERGFFFYDKVKSTDQGTVEVSESSAWCCFRGGETVQGPFMWLRIDTDIETYHSAEKGEGIAHLTVKQAKKLRRQIDHWIKDHD